MKTSFVGIAAGLALAAAALPARAQFGTAVMAGGRRHAEHSRVSTLPFKKGDTSAVFGLQLHDALAYWRLGLGYAWEAGDSDDVDRVLTPQLHLVFHEQYLALAVGIMKSFVSDKVRGDYESEMYYDLQAGLELPMGRFRISLMASYPFSDWGKLSEFKSGDLEYTAGISFRF